MSQRSSKKRGPRRGAALVELAVVAPVFLVFVVGMIELGRAIMVQQELTNATREGARVAGYDSTTQTSTVTSAVNSYLSNVNISGATTTVSPDPPSGAADGQSVSVTVSIGYNRVSWVPSPFFLNGRTLQATSAMRREPAP